MSDDSRCDPQADCFKPPAIPTEVFCLHCQHEYESYLIHWVEEKDAAGRTHGFWCCPTPGCDGKGFGFDIHPTDPNWRDENGEKHWHDDDDCDEDEEGSPADAAARQASAREEEALDYIFYGDSPRVIDPAAEPTPDGVGEPDAEFDEAMFDEEGEPIEGLSAGDDDETFGADEEAAVEPWRPPLVIDPSRAHSAHGDNGGAAAIPPHHIGPIHVDFARPGDAPVSEEDIPF